MKDYLLAIVESLYHLINDYLPFKKKPKPSLLAMNIVWFTHCSWLEQLIAFKQISRYYSFK
jgi:CRISPR/Cas system type I-B associated protein Csh2 (Cas7 group RAMP superfamily)